MLTLIKGEKSMKEFNEESQENKSFEKPKTSKQSNPNQSVRMVDILNNYSSNGPLSADADEYLKKLRLVLEDQSQPIKIIAKRLTSFQGAIAFTSQSYGIILVFEDEHPQTIHEILQAGLVKKAQMSFEKDYHAYKLINIISIDKFSYGKYLQMAEYILKCFKVKDDDNIKNLTIDKFSKNLYTIDIETNLGEVKNFINTYSPREINPRCDFGFICSISNETDSRFKNQERNYSNRQKLFAVSAFVEFVPDNADLFMQGQSVPKFTPLVRITEIISLIPTEAIIPLVLSLCAEIFCTYNSWQSPYRIIKKGSPNIGGLIIDPKTNKPSTIGEKDVNGFFNTFFNPPALSIDLNSNFNFIPGLPNITTPGGMIDAFCNFLKTPITEPGPIADIFFSEIIGTAEVKGITERDIIDSRYLDFLNISNVIGYNEKVSKLLYRYEDPFERSNTISELITDFRKNSVNYCAVINNSFLKLFSRVIAPHVSMVSNINHRMPVVNNNLLKNNVYQQAPMMNNGFGKNYANPPFIY